MIRIVQSCSDCRKFVEEIQRNPRFSDPMLVSAAQVETNLIRAIEARCAFGTYRDGKMTGLFALLILPEEKYIEMLVGLSRDPVTYVEFFEYMQAHYPGYQADFVFNPGNTLLKNTLIERRAIFEPEQQKMVFSLPALEVDTEGIYPYDEKYARQYFDMHNWDTYWTGEKVAEARDQFKIFLALADDRVVGYMDVTGCFDENEVYDLYVLEKYRRKGYGRKLVAQA